MGTTGGNGMCVHGYCGRPTCSKTLPYGIETGDRTTRPTDASLDTTGEVNGSLEQTWATGNAKLNAGFCRPVRALLGLNTKKAVWHIQKDVGGLMMPGWNTASRGSCIRGEVREVT